jgi:hypothetical protein
MAITKVRTVPSELPHAHLYLDDIEEICAILTDAFDSSWNDSAQIVTAFYANQETQFDSIADLQEYGGSSSYFTIEVGSYDRLIIHGFLPPELNLYSLDDQKRWLAHSKIKAVFEVRQYAVKNALSQAPGWLRVTLFALFAVGTPLLLVAIHVRHYVFVAYITVLFAFMFCAAFMVFCQSRVSFVRFHERSRVASESRKAWVKAISLIVAGAVIGKIIERLAAHWWAGK